MPRARIPSLVSWLERAALLLLASAVALRMAPPWSHLALGLISAALLLPPLLWRLGPPTLAPATALGLAVALVAFAGQAVPLLAWATFCLGLVRIWQQEGLRPRILALSAGAALLATYAFAYTPSQAVEAAGALALAAVTGFLLVRITQEPGANLAELASLRQQVAELLALRRAGYELRAGTGSERVLHTLAEHAQLLTGAPYSLAVSLSSSDRFDRWAAFGYTTAQVERLGKAERSILLRVVSTRRPVRLADASSDPEYLRLAPHVRSLLALPVIYRGRPVAALQLESPEPSAFTASHLAGLQQLADEAGWALKHLQALREQDQRLEHAERRRAEETAGLEERLGELEQELQMARVLSELAQDLARTADAEAGLRSLVAKMVEVFQVDGAAAWLREEPGLSCRAAAGGLAEGLQGAQAQRETGLHGLILRERGALLVPDTGAESRLSVMERGLGAGSLLIAPLVAAGEIEGCLTLLRAAGRPPLGPLELERVVQLGHRLSPLLQHARLSTEARESERRQAALEGMLRGLSAASTPAHLLRAFLSYAPSLLPCQWAALAWEDGPEGGWAISAQVGEPGAVSETPLQPASGLFLRALRQPRVEVVPDLRELDHALLDESLAASGMRSLLLIPLPQPGRSAAVLAVATSSQSAYSPDLSPVLTAVRELLAAAQLRVREDQQRSREAERLQAHSGRLTTVLRASHALRSRMALAELLEEAAGVAVDLGFEAACLALVGGQGGGELSVGARRGQPRFRLPLQVTELVALMREEFRLSHSYFVPDGGGADGGPARRDRHEWRPGDLFLVPLRQAGGELAGVLALDRPADGRRPDRPTAELMELFAAQVAGSVQAARLYEEIQRMAITDGLLGIYNRRYFEERMAGEFTRAQRYRHPLSLLMVEVDRLKQVNDELGHQAGDRALQTVARTLLDNTRSVDVVCRYGGDEIAVILPETEAEEAVRLAERLRQKVAAQRVQGMPLSISLGVASSAPGVKDWEALVRLADQACYQAKRGGRNQVAAAGPLTAALEATALQ